MRKEGIKGVVEIQSFQPPLKSPPYLRGRNFDATSIDARSTKKESFEDSSGPLTGKPVDQDRCPFNQDRKGF
jgi:hypothetical protein